MENSFVDYCATKAGAWMVHDGLAAELREVHKTPGVKTTIVHPTWANTPLIATDVEALRRSMTVIEPQVISDGVVKQYVLFPVLYILPARQDTDTLIESLPVAVANSWSHPV